MFLLRLLPIAIFSIGSVALAAETHLHLTLKDHRYAPDSFVVNANERFQVTVRNEDVTSDEFESRSMIIEKFILPKKSVTFVVGPLKPGEYDFFACFHPSTGKGKIIAK
jgi:hypothetical protein